MFVVWKGVDMMPYITVEVEGGKLTLLGGDEVMREVSKRNVPLTWRLTINYSGKSTTTPTERD